MSKEKCKLEKPKFFLLVNNLAKWQMFCFPIIIV